MSSVLKKPWQAKTKILEGLEKKLDAAIDKVTSVNHDVELNNMIKLCDRLENRIANAKGPMVMVAEPEVEYGADAYERYMRRTRRDKKPLCSELTKCVVILSSNEHDDEDVAMRKEHKQWNRINEFTKKNNLEPMKIYRRGIMGQGVLNEYYRNAIAYMRSGKADALVVVNMAMISSGIADAYYKVGQVVEAGFKVYTVDEKEQSLYLYQPPVRKEA